MFESRARIFEYFLVTLGMASLIILSYFHEELDRIFGSIPKHLWPLPAIAYSILIAFAIYKREKWIDSAKYEFLTVVTHKFRTPLSTLKWLMGDLRKEQNFNERQETVKQVDITVDRIIGILDVLADIARVDERLSYAFKAVSFRELLERTLSKYSPLVKQRGITFNIYAENNLPLVVIDEAKIQFVIDILLDNALKYNQSNSSIDIALQWIGKKTVFSVHDNGIGLTKDERAHLFQRLYRGEEAKKIDTEGMGMALSVAQKIAKFHGGRIWAESPGRGKGTTFHLEIKIGRS